MSTVARDKVLVPVGELELTLDRRTGEILERRSREAVPRRRGWLMRRMLLGADLLGLAAAFAVAVLLTPAPTEASRLAVGWEVLLLLLSLPVWVLLFRLYGLYDRDDQRADHTTVDDVIGVLNVVTLGTWLFYVGALATGLLNPGIGRLFVFWLAAVAFVPAARAGARVYGRRTVAYVQNTIIVGAGDVGRLVAKKARKNGQYGINVVGFVDREPKDDGGDGPPLLGPPEALPVLVDALGVDRVIIAFTGDRHEETLDLIRSVKDYEVQVDIVPRLFEVVGVNTSVHMLEGLPLVGLPPLRLSRSSRILKRSMDIVCSTVGLILLSPLFAVAAAAIKLDTRGPVFFRQVRMGEGERTFRIYKFRTMVDDAEERKEDVAHLNMHVGDDSRMFKVPDDPRVTRVGAFLRRWRIDELPQLINVVRGEMSLVGPRPLILDEDQFIERWARKRLQLKPGITGLWQVLGASDIPFDEMTKLDYLYVTNWSLSEDLRLIFLTLPSLARRRDAY